MVKAEGEVVVMRGFLAGSADAINATIEASSLANVR